MTATEKLNAIRINCRQLLSRPYPDTSEARLARAGWQATLAAIESVQIVNRGASPSLTQREDRLVEEILAAWEGLL